MLYALAAEIGIARAIIEGLLKKAGVQIGGSRDQDIVVCDDRFYVEVLLKGPLGLGEAFAKKWWWARKLDVFFCHLALAEVGTGIPFDLPSLLNIAKATLTNRQSRRLARRVASHYDLGNDLYARMLGSSMAYTCAYFSGDPPADTLDTAQFAKLDLVCRKLGLKPGDRVLETGCGWGVFARYAAEHYGVSVVGVTLSKEQRISAMKACEGYDVEIRLQDWRDVSGKFDFIVSIGMTEHVGPKNYREYLSLMRRCLRRRLRDGRQGLFLLHTIGSNRSRVTVNAWIEKYIFPGGVVPSLKQLAGAMEGLFVVEELHNFGADYDRTLMEWYQNFVRAWPEFEKEYGEEFFPVWTYYLLSCAGTFRARGLQLWQFVLSRDGVQGGYQTVR